MTNIEKQQIMLSRFKKAVKNCNKTIVTYNELTKLYDLIFYKNNQIQYKFCFLTQLSAEKFRYTLLH